MRVSFGLTGLLFTGMSFAAAATAGAAQAPANYVFDNVDSSVTIAHIGDLGNSSTAYTLPGAPLAQLQQNAGSPPANLQSYVTVPGSSIPTANAGTQLNDKFTYTSDSGTSTTKGVGGVYQTTTSNNMFVGLASGTGVNQNNAGGYFQGASAVDVNVKAQWQLNAPFPINPNFPGISYQFPIAGTVGINGTDHFIVALTFYEVSRAVSTPVGSINIDQAYNNVGGNSPLAFSQLFSGTALLNGGNPIGPGVDLEILGDIVFKAKDPDSPSDFSFSQDAQFGAFNSATDPSAPVPAPAAMGLVGFGLLFLGRRKVPSSFTAA